MVALDKNFHMKCYKCEVGWPPGPQGWEVVGHRSLPGGWWAVPAWRSELQFSGGGGCSWLSPPRCSHHCASWGEGLLWGFAEFPLKF